jgi:hypothetical protein
VVALFTGIKMGFDSTLSLIDLCGDVDMTPGKNTIQLLGFADTEVDINI